MEAIQQLIARISAAGTVLDQAAAVIVAEIARVQLTDPAISLTWAAPSMRLYSLRGEAVTLHAALVMLQIAHGNWTFMRRLPNAPQTPEPAPTPGQIAQVERFETLGKALSEAATLDEKRAIIEAA